MKNPLINNEKCPHCGEEFQQFYECLACDNGSYNDCKKCKGENLHCLNCYSDYRVIYYIDGYKIIKL
jgi:hypothetical protein